MSTKSNLIDIRMKLSGGRAVVSGLLGTTKETEKLGKATSKTSAASEKARKVTGRLTGAYHDLSGAAKVGLGFLGVGGVLAIESAVQATEELSKTTTGLTRNLGFQTNVASRWGALAQAREIDTKSLNMSFSTLSTKMVEAGRKGGTLLTPFHQLGISQEEVAKGADNFQWGLMRVAKALGEEEGGAKRSVAAKALLGKGYQSLLPLFSEGTKGLKEQLHWADEYGVTLSGKTNEGIMEMVQSQRENKVAMLGLKVSLTTALMPAIKAGDDQLQEFIKTLNSPTLSGEQKIERITKQFEGLEGELVKVLEKALPKLAEDGGKLGLQIAGAVWHGFWHSDTLGKLAIGGWLLAKMGGFGVIGSLGAKVGGKLATTLGTRFLEAVAPYFAAEAGVEGLGSALGSQMGGLKTLFASKGKILGLAMGVAAAGALVAEVVFAVEDSENIAGLSLINTPQIGQTSSEEEMKYLNEHGFSNVGLGSSGSEIEAISPKGKHVTFTKHGNHWKQHVTNKIDGPGGRPVAPGVKKHPRRQTMFGGGDIVIHNHTYLDGHQIAENTLRHSKNRAALK